MIDRLGRSWISSAKVYAISVVLSQALSLFRLLLVARLVGPEVQGQLAFLAIFSSFFGAIAVNSSAWQLVGWPGNPREALQPSLQFIGILRGFAVGGLLALVGSIAAVVLGRGNLVIPCLCLALIPIVEGLMRLDPWIYLRDGNYWRLGALEISSAVFGLVSAVCILFFRDDIWVPVGAALVAAAAKVVFSHVSSSGRFAVFLDRALLLPIFRYAMPLVPAGLFFWVNGQADKLIVLVDSSLARNGDIDDLGLASLGQYATVAGLFLLGHAAIARIVQASLIPAAGRAVNGDAEGVRVAGKILRWTVLVELVIVLASSALGPTLVQVVLGQKYELVSMMTPLFGITLSFKLCRTTCYDVATGLGRTGVIMYGNLGFLSGSVFAIGGVMFGWGVWGVAFGYCAGEVVASGLCVWLVTRLSSELAAVLRSGWLWGMVCSGLLLGLRFALSSFDSPVLHRL